jgi:hypothetical protein
MGKGMKNNQFGFPGISMVIHGYPWISMDIHGSQWISMDINGLDN